MAFLCAGVLGFIAAYAFDLAALAGWRRGKPLIGGVSTLLLLLAIVGAALSPPRFARPPWLAVLGGLLAAGGHALLLYSLFIELPARRTYVLPGASTGLVTTGTYALCRHPGVLWFTLLIAGLVALSGSRWLLWATPIWVALDVCYVWLQDRYLFPRQFPDYAEYQHTTPMLIPTRRSLSRCWQTR